MNPLTWIIGAFSMWIVVLGVNKLGLSIAVIIIAQALRHALRTIDEGAINIGGNQLGR